MPKTKIVPVMSRADDGPRLKPGRHIKIPIADHTTMTLVVENLGEVILAGSTHAVLKVHQMLRSLDWSVDL